MKKIYLSLTICLLINSLAAQITLIPDTNFENHLISQGFDSGVPDGIVLTANIDTITSLFINGNGFSNQITDLTGIQDFTNLSDLSCRSNDLVNLNLNQNAALTNLICDENFNLTTIDVTQNSNLTLLTCSLTHITSIDLSNNLALTTLVCGGQFITSIDVSNNPALISFECAFSPLLACMNIKNGNNINLNSFNATFNPSLMCIEVDDTAWSANNWINWINIDTSASFSTNCGNLCSNASCNVFSNYTYIDNGNGNYTFTNTSIGNYNQSHWAFGDGNTSTTVNPNHTFTANGVYIVVLTVNDSTIGGSCIDYYIDTIIVTGVLSPPQCVAGFVMYPDTATGNVTVVNSSIGTNLTYFWDFGDGNTSTQAYPTHVYATSGPFYLCLFISDSTAGCNDVYCDSIGVNGVVFKQAGFTINVITPPILTGINYEMDLASEIDIYPNPTLNQLTVVSEQLEVSKINIIDITGKTLKTITPVLNIINVANLPSGLYFIELIGEEKTIIKKFVKQ